MKSPPNNLDFHTKKTYTSYATSRISHRRDEDNRNVELQSGNTELSREEQLELEINESSVNLSNPKFD